VPRVGFSLKRVILTPGQNPDSDTTPLHGIDDNGGSDCDDGGGGVVVVIILVVVVVVNMMMLIVVLMMITVRLMFSVGSARRTTLCKTRTKWTPKLLPLTSSFLKK